MEGITGLEKSFADDQPRSLIQTIDTTTADVVLSQGFDAAAKEKPLHY